MCLVLVECWDGAACIPVLLMAGVVVVAVVAGLWGLVTTFGRRVAAPQAGTAGRAVRRDGPDARDAGEACTASVSCAALPAESGPDIHLVMNTFNRIAGESQFDQGAAADPIFALSDYLRQCLVHTGPAQVALHEEVDMLQSYLKLASIFQGRDLRAAVELAPGSGEVRVQAHSICLVAQLLLAGLGPESKGRYILAVRVQGAATGGIDVDIALRPDFRSPDTHLRQPRQLRAELGRLAASMSRRSVRWSCRVVRDPQSDIAVSLRIRPRPAH